MSLKGIVLETLILTGLATAPSVAYSGLSDGTYTSLRIQNKNKEILIAAQDTGPLSPFERSFISSEPYLQYTDNKWWEVEKRNEEEMKRRQEMTDHPIRTAKEQYKKFQEWDGSPESREWAKDAAGKIMEQSGIPYARDIIEEVDELNKRTGSYQDNPDDRE